MTPEQFIGALPKGRVVFKDAEFTVVGAGVNVKDGSVSLLAEDRKAILGVPHFIQHSCRWYPYEWDGQDDSSVAKLIHDRCQLLANEIKAKAAAGEWQSAAEEE